MQINLHVHMHSNNKKTGKQKQEAIIVLAWFGCDLYTQWHCSEENWLSISQ